MRMSSTLSEIPRARLQASLVDATKVRWTYVAPTLLVVWIVSMFDKSNISLVINDPEFLTEMGLTGQAALLGWLASSLFIAYGVTAPAWGWAVDHWWPAQGLRAKP